MRFSYKLLSLACLTLSAIAGPTTQLATAADVKLDLEDINAAVMMLDKSIWQFDGTATKFAMLQSDLMHVSQMNKKATWDVKAIAAPISFSDGSDMLTIVDNGMPGVKRALMDLVAHKRKFQASGTVSMVSSSLMELETEVIEFANMMESKSPMSLRSRVEAIKAAFVKAFNDALKDFEHM